ncbi:unnamed protein product [Cunninghamella blakesleeana]
MRFTSLAIVAAALMMSVQAAPVSVKGSVSTQKTVSLDIVFTELKSVQSVTQLTNVCTLINGVSSQVQTQIFAVINNPTKLTQLIATLPTDVQGQLGGLVTLVKGLPTGVLSQLTNVTGLFGGLGNGKLQSLLDSLPLGLSTQLLSLPNLVAQLPALISTADLTGKVQGQLTAVTSILSSGNLNVAQLTTALTKLQTVISSVGGLQNLPLELRQPITLIQTTLLQVTQISGNGDILTGAVGTLLSTANTLVGGSLAGVDGNILTTIFGLAGTVQNTVTVTLSQLKVTSLSGVISLPTNLIESTPLASIATVVKGGLSEVPVIALVNSFGLPVSALTDKVVLPTELVDALGLKL